MAWLLRLCILLLLTTAPALADPPDPPVAEASVEGPELSRLYRRWGQVQGLMAGVVYAHAIQPIGVAAGALEWNDKYWISLSGTALYSVALAGLLLEKRFGIYIAIFGPVVGLTSVLTGWLLGAVGAIEATIRPDAFQIAGGVLQVLAAALSIWLWKNEPRFQRERVALRVGPVPGPGRHAALGATLAF